MKISNLSLAILVALGVAACGGSGGGSDNKPADPPRPQTPQPQAPSNPNADNSAIIVDPTKTHVVDNKDLSKQETVGTLQYIRREGSNYDKSFNPNQPASATPFLGVHLDDQNPSLTNIVLARQNLQRADGQPVKAQFTGSTNREPLNADGTVAATQVTTAGNASLQLENFGNVDVLAGAFALDATNKNTENSHKFDTVYKNREFTNRKRESTLAAANIEAFSKKDNKFVVVTQANHFKAAPGTGTDKAPYDVLKADESLTAISAVRTAKAPKEAFKNDWNAAAVYKTDVAATKDVPGSVVVTAASIGSTIPLDKARRYGGNLVWWSSPNDAFENTVTRSGSAPIHKAIPGGAPAVTDAQNATTGLVRIGGGLETLGQELNWNSEDKKWVDHHNTTTRIFGRYHLAFADKGKVNPVTLNTFVGATSFVSELVVPADTTATLQQAVDGNFKPKSYSIGAIPGHLEHVQYGRVTTNLDLDLDPSTKTYGDGFMHAPYLAKNNDGSVDNYFYRGTNATTIAEMAALPTDKKLTYQGHALMYGIDNSYHGDSGKKDLPNAFNYGGSEGQLGLGNFVKAEADLATKKLTGYVYNAWLLDQNKAEVKEDRLVTFEGNIVGNSAFGSADRFYVAGDDKADFRASFFGDKAEELGGSFNSVHSIPSNGTAQSYGSAYGTGDWGGVFGARQAGSGNTFQGDDGANVYTGTN